MKKILFATGNSRKTEEANATLSLYDIAVEAVSVDIDEIQHHDSIEIIKAKARSAFAVTRQPVVVSDTCWEIPALGGFPGGYMKDMSAWLQAEDWLALMARHNDKTMYCHEHVAYFDGEEVRLFTSAYRGRFIDEARGRIDDNESFEQVVILYGDKTMAEQLAQGEIASAGESLEHWKQFGQWFSNKP